MSDVKIKIGNRFIYLDEKVAERVEIKRAQNKARDRRIAKEMREANLLPNVNGSGNKHAVCIGESFTERKRDKTTSETRRAVIDNSNTARKMNLETEWQKAKARAFKI